MALRPQLEKSILGYLRGLYWAQSYTCCIASPLGDIVRSHGLSYHFYADDSQLYITFKPINEIVTISNIEACIIDINNWMISNKLKLNKGKTELLVIGSNSRCRPLVESITVAGEYITG